MTGDDLAASDAAIERLLDRGARRAARHGAGAQALWDAMRSGATGGKRFRPRLVLIAHDAFGGAERTAAIEIGAALELLHTAFVIHDDLIDGDDVRRGRPNVSGRYRAGYRDDLGENGSERLAQAAAVLAGDLALTTAMLAIAGSSASRARTARVLDLLDEAVHASAAGELEDVRLAHLDLDADVPLDASLAVAEWKTAVYSFRFPLQAGAVLAGASADDVDALGRLGGHLGTAFQLLDDLDGVFGDEAVTGKSARSDLRTATRTALIVFARETAEWPAVLERLGDPDLDDAGAADLRERLDRSGARQRVVDLVDRELEAASAVAREHGLPAAIRHEVLDLVARLRVTAA